MMISQTTLSAIEDGVLFAAFSESIYRRAETDQSLGLSDIDGLRDTAAITLNTVDTEENSIFTFDFNLPDQKIRDLLANFSICG
ncbi:MAG: hypothetical protein AAFW83_14675 [Pseudomonadota bacterium]